MKKIVLLLLLCFISLFPLKGIAQVDYATQIQPIFNGSCIGCHGGTSGVSLGSYAQVMNSVGNLYGTAIVVPNEPDESPLVDKIEPNPTLGSRMPQGGALSEDQINLIRAWIAEGANEVITSTETENEIPTEFIVEGNYPNPFNPSTIIQYVAPSQGTIRLSVYSISGQIVNEQNASISAGRSSIRVNLSGNPSGLYVYRIQFQGVNGAITSIVRKMTLIK